MCSGEVKPTPEGGNQKIKLKVRINPSGVFNVSSAAMIEKVEIEEEVPVQMEVRVPHGLFLSADPDFFIPDPRSRDKIYFMKVIGQKTYLRRFRILFERWKSGLFVCL